METILGGETFHRQCWQPLLLGTAQGKLMIIMSQHYLFNITKGGLTDDHVLILPIGHQASQVKDSLFLSSF